MADTTYVNGVTLTDADWFNDVDRLHYTILGDPATAKAVLDAIQVHGADIASATTTNLETATGDLVDVTGTTTITAITLSEGHKRTVRFTGALTLTNGASLVLPGGANITTASGDYAVFRGYAAGVVRCIFYMVAAQTLYQTGTWTPVLTFATPGNLSVSYSTQVGSFTKNGRLVTAMCQIVTSAFTFTTASGALRITGLPFAALTLTGAVWIGAATWQGITNTHSDINASVASGASLATLTASGSAAGQTGINASDMPTGGNIVIQFTLTYEAAS